MARQVYNGFTTLWQYLIDITHVTEGATDIEIVGSITERDLLNVESAEVGLVWVKNATADPDNEIKSGGALYVYDTILSKWVLVSMVPDDPFVFDRVFPTRHVVAQLPIDDPNYGLCHYLDMGTNRTLEIAYPVENLQSITAMVRSSNNNVTGTVEVVPIVNGRELDIMTFEVTNEWTKIILPLKVEEGVVTLRRNGGTLIDGTAVAAIMRGITIWEAL